MDLRWLEDVLILLEEGNLTRAAERRGITQPAFSRRVRAVEAWLGTNILDRHTNRVEIRPGIRESEAELRALVLRLQELRSQICLGIGAPRRVAFAAQHALTLSIFTDILKLVNDMIEPLTYRLRTANRVDCISMCLRGDADVLLCYDAEEDAPLPFDVSFERFVWSTDRMVPVVGGKLLYSVDTTGKLPNGAPLIAYPGTSYFGQLIEQSVPGWAVARQQFNTVCESAFSAGLREMVLRSVGMAWVPMSLIWRDIEAGRAANLNGAYGSCGMSVCLYVRRSSYFSSHILPRIAQLRGAGAPPDGKACSFPLSSERPE